MLRNRGEQEATPTEREGVAEQEGEQIKVSSLNSLNVIHTLTKDQKFTKNEEILSSKATKTISKNIVQTKRTISTSEIKNQIL